MSFKNMLTIVQAKKMITKPMPAAFHKDITRAIVITCPKDVKKMSPVATVSKTKMIGIILNKRKSMIILIDKKICLIWQGSLSFQGVLGLLAVLPQGTNPPMPAVSLDSMKTKFQRSDQLLTS